MTDIKVLYEHYLENRIICTDTRTITDGCLFFALKGENFDANTFAENALVNGAAYVIIDNQDYKINNRCLLVPDVLTALQDLAKFHRMQLTIPVIGLTGSNGKTTTKELIKAVLSEKYRTFATKGNLNNHIGVPLSLLSLTDDIEIAVIEMGANHQKEIELLCSIARPTHGLITNVGLAHLDGFGGFEGVKKGKAELFDYLKQHEGYTFINSDNPHLIEMSTTAGLDKVIYYGTSGHAAVSGKLLDTDPLISFSWTDQKETYQASANLTGSYNFENILAAICIGVFFGVPAEQVNSGLSGYHPNNNRSQITNTGSNTVICDFYNANPSSMSAALLNIDGLNAASKVVIIGDMFELGPESAVQHRNIADQASKLEDCSLIFIGSNFYALKEQYRGHFFSTPREAADFLRLNPVKNSLILLKGSRGMALEQLLPLI
ncbi:UDP-N-acetylmuramoyl-tripeptide--D-alanyl-D-alanine ligase [Pedobacter metabolipauper]|uniref:UDP-N-acetylmuramoyl-tripeptide--D-alanyl-D-alanine ligase n=1 Tax=Pedobacter metabolipauper TaxID=425513 RepID=A0A4R6SXV6_9SPHI|nr:UDP-N-acetylmuramoyl-tripeptide--D-alanyl-D-alanine ligase [Pedobacter metabolipauper]TDQ09504.1 UDP-N-acetylmuramoyl-tripeptide--D-alanyl-D-alanine ligase [Pedobacter metabolipauper]